eukprot:11016630-Karenia_brevis.AAC.1
MNKGEGAVGTGTHHDAAGPMDVDSVEPSHPVPRAHVPLPPPPPPAQRSTWHKGQWYPRDTGSWGWHSEGYKCDCEQYEKECDSQNNQEQDWPFTSAALCDADKAKRSEELSWPVVPPPDQDHDEEDPRPRGSAYVAHGMHSA